MLLVPTLLHARTRTRTRTRTRSTADACIRLATLAPQADGFSAASDCRQKVAARLEQPGDLREALLGSVGSPQYSIDQLGVPEVRHCLFRIPQALAPLEQYSAPRTGCRAGPQSPYHHTRAVRRLLKHYMLAHARVHAQPAKPLREYMQLSADEMRSRGTALK